MSIGAPLDSSNRLVYEDASTVDHYRNAFGLQASEIYILDKYLKRDIRVLDIGVGGGRTTPYLSSDQRSYVGVDYSKAMINVCKEKYPLLSFFALDASDLSQFEKGSFDLAVFSFNGIDYLNSDEKRQACLLEVFRVLGDDGLFVFSVHNSRNLLLFPSLSSVGFVKWTWRLLRSVGKSATLIIRQLTRKSFYLGHGYILDPVHGGLQTHVSIPKFVAIELAEAGFDLLEVIDGNYPAKTGIYMAPWFYYVAKKSNNAQRRI